METNQLKKYARYINIGFVALLAILFCTGDFIKDGWSSITGLEMLKDTLSNIGELLKILTRDYIPFKYKILSVVLNFCIIAIPVCLVIALIDSLIHSNNAKRCAGTIFTCYLVFFVGLLVFGDEVRIGKVGTLGLILPMVISGIWIFMAYPQEESEDDDEADTIVEAATATRVAPPALPVEKTVVEKPAVAPAAKEPTVDEIAAELDKLASLKDRGLITDSEYTALKAKVLKI